MSTDRNDTNDMETSETGGSIEELASRVDRLESLVEKPNNTNETKHRRSGDTIHSSGRRDERETIESSSGSWISRRETLAAGGVLTLLGLGTGSAVAQQGRGQGGPGGAIYNWKQDVEANGHQLSGLGALSMADASEAISDFTGENLEIEAGRLTAVPPTRWHDDVDADGNDLSNVGALSTAENSTGITEFAGENLSIDDSGVLNASAGTSELSGKKIPLDIIQLGDDLLTFPIEADPGDFIPIFDRAIIPFNALELPYISQIFLQFVSEVSADDWATIRMTEGGEQRWLSGSYQIGLIEGSLVEYWGDYELTTVAFSATLEDRPSDDTSYFATFSDAVLIVWGEVV